MLRVKTFLATSSIPGAGLGLFAAEPIAQGTVVWCFDKGFDVLTDLQSLPPDPTDIFLRSLVRYGYRVEDAKGEGLYCFCTDDARFVNHSSTPNLFDEPIFNCEGRTLAKRDIPEGEELLCDYNLMSPADPATGWRPGDGYALGPRGAAFLAGRMCRDEFLSVFRQSSLP